MQLFLDAATRVFRAQAPDGPHRLDSSLTDATVVMTVPDAAWQSTYYPAWLAAHQTGQELVVAVDGSTSQVAHVANPREQAIAAVRAFRSNPAPTAADAIVALKALIAFLEASRLTQ